jgi:hypothetical protein
MLGIPRRAMKAVLAWGGYQIRRAPRSGPEAQASLDREAFERHARAIQARHDAQTRETIATLSRRYEPPVLGRVRVFSLLERLGQCIDPTDGTLGCVSQEVHVLQVAAAMEADGVADPDLLLVALIHDLGKLLLVQGNAPEDVVCGANPVGENAPGAGLDRCVLQWGHAEFVYRRFRDHVPEHVAWLLRYHNVSIGRCAPLMDARDRAWTERYLRPFQQYDQDSKSRHRLPPKALAAYRDQIESAFPEPILF